MGGAPARTLAAALAAAALIALPAGPASAHALLESSSPRDGALVEEAPGRLVLTFTEAPDLGLSTIQVLDAQGRDLAPGELRSGAADEEVVVPLPELGEGVYTVSWRVLSTVDGHVTAGAFAFGVGVEPAPVDGGGGGGGTVERPSPLSVAGRWALYWGLAILLGAAIAGLYVERGAPRRLRPLAWAAWGAAATGLAAMFLAERSAAGVSAGALLGSDRGGVLLLRGAGVLAAGLATAAATLRPRRPWFAVLGGTVLLAMLAHAWAGHAGAAGSLRPAKVGIQWLHLAAAGAWVGGLVWLLAARRRAGGDDAGMEAVRRFSRLAGVAIAVVAVTGAARAIDEVGSLGALFGSGFGRSALGKSALFAGMISLGAYNRFRLIPRGGLHTLGRTVAAEVVLAAGVFGLTGIMAGLAPPATVTGAAAPRPEGVVVSGSDFATTVRARLVANPGYPGPNDFEVRLTDFDTGEPAEARAVTLRFRMPSRPEVGTSELDLARETGGTWTGRGTNLSVAGRWEVGVLVEQEADSVQVDLELETRLPEQRIQEIPGGPGEPTLYQIELGGGRSVQGYVDPGRAGEPNEVHFTFFSAEGGELPIASIEISAVPEGGAPVPAEPRRLTPGHFVATVEPEPGEWRFEMVAETEEGDPLSAYFVETIEEGA